MSKTFLGIVAGILSMVISLVFAHASVGSLINFWYIMFSLIFGIGVIILPVIVINSDL